MIPRVRRHGDRPGSSRVMLWVAAALAIWPWPGRAEAQWRFGYSFDHGWGTPAFNYVPSPTDFLNQRAVINARSASGPTSNNPYAASSNAYFNNLRDDGFRDRYNFATRRNPSESRVARSASRATPPAQAGVSATPSTSAGAPGPVMSISSYFNRDEVLVWPSDAPVDGDLGPKRATSDKASRAVLHEYNQQGLARIATAIEARERLLDYGRPALRSLRESSTARVADAFSRFLLSLYDSLAQATTTTPRRPTPP